MGEITKIDGAIAIPMLAEWGLNGVPDSSVDFYLYDDCGIFAVRDCQFGGVEVHIAFKPESRCMARKASLAMMAILPRPIYAFITGNRASVVNLTKRLGFVDLGTYRLTDSKGDRLTRILRAE